MPNVQLPQVNMAASTILPNQGIRDVLSRWQTVDGGTITTATVGQIDAYTLPDQFFSVTQVARVLEGYQGIRGTFLVRVSTNANASQQGLLALRYIPQALIGGMLTNARNANAITKFQVPTAWLFTSTMSAMELKVPFISPNLFHDFQSGAGDWGVVYFDVASPLKVGATGSNTFTYTVQMCMDPNSIELFNPTYSLSPFPTSAYRVERSQNKMKAGFTRRGASEASAAASGPLSKALSLVGTGASALGSLVPTLESVTWPVAAIANASARAASAFGYSKPLDDKAQQRTVTTLAPYAQNCDGVSTAYNLGLSCQNKVACLPGFAGSAVDEMSISYLVSRETYHQSVNWAHDTATGTALLNIPLRPNYFQTTLIGPPAQTLAGPLGYLSNFFYLYHGSIRLTLRFVKTPRHQGRMIVAFYPGGTITSDPGYTYVGYAPQEIIDISTGEEWVFTFPYTSQKYYEDIGTQYGRVIIYVMNELTGDATVADNIDFLVFVSAVEDFEYAFPRVNNGAFIATGVDSLERSQNKCADGPFQRKTAYVTVGNTKTTPQGEEYAAYCQGERILSIKQLMLAHHKLGFLLATANQFYKMRPFTIGITTDATAAGTGEWAGDTYSQFAPLYAFSRGGVIIGCLMPNGTGNNSPFSFWVQPNVNNDTSPITGGGTAPGSYTAARTYVNSTIYSAVYVPQYTQNQCRLNRVSTWRAGTGVAEPVDQYSQLSLLYLAFNTGAPTVMPTISRSAADDTQFGFFLGVPPYVVGLQTTPEPENEPPAGPDSEALPVGGDVKLPNPMSEAVHSPSARLSPAPWARKDTSSVTVKKTLAPTASTDGTLTPGIKHLP